MHDFETVTTFEDIDLAGRSIVLCDLDGCLISGTHVYRSTGAFVKRCGERLWIVSNNSSDTAASLSSRLAALKLDIDAARIVLAGQEALLQFAGQHMGSAISLQVDAPLRLLASQLGIADCAIDPDVVLVGRDPRFNLARLEEIAAFIVDGAQLWITNPDRTHPSATGKPVPETGVLLAAIEACCGPVAARSIGKPAPDMIEIALERSGADRSRALFIGDNAATDGEAARAAGIDFVRIRHAALPSAERAVRTDFQGATC